MQITLQINLLNQHNLQNDLLSQHSLQINLQNNYVVHIALYFDTDTTPYAQSIPDLQTYIEEPEIHVLAMNSSSIEDQAALISDRMECIRQLNTDLKAADNIAISDKLLFFYW